MERQTQADVLNRHRVSTGVRAWRHLLHCLTEMDRLYGPFGEPLCAPDRVCTTFSNLSSFFFAYVCVCVCVFLPCSPANFVSRPAHSGILAPLQKKQK